MYIYVRLSNKFCYNINFQLLFLLNRIDRKISKENADAVDNQNRLIPCYNAHTNLLYITKL